MFININRYAFRIKS